jgi:class 3 adenylate cyclase
MDRHEIPPGTTVEDASGAHGQDLKFQTKHGCRSLSFWFDEQRSTGFCLFEAPSKKAVQELHKESHGLIPSKIIEVDEDVGKAFLGRIEDPGSEVEKMVTAFRVIMFTDLKDSTKMTQDYGDKIAMDLIRAHNHIIRQNIHKHQGREIKHTGDGFMISFSSASNAVECSIAIQKAFTVYNGENQVTPMHIRIGLNAGEPVADSGDLFGTCVQLASRICDHSEAGIIMATSVIHELCHGKQINFIDKGGIALKGFETTTHVYEINWQG